VSTSASFFQTHQPARRSAKAQRLELHLQERLVLRPSKSRRESSNERSFRIRSYERMFFLSVLHTLEDQGQVAGKAKIILLTFEVDIYRLFFRRLS